MPLSHEKLDVYQLAVRYVVWAYQSSVELHKEFRHLKEQWIRASHSIPLNIAEGNGKSSANDRARFLEIARGSAMECAAIQDILSAMEHLDKNVSNTKKVELDRICAMLSKLIGRNYGR